MNLTDYLQQQPRGAHARLAADIGAHRPDLSDWITGARKVPSHRCSAIESASGGQVTVEELRPDLRWIRIPDAAWPVPAGRPLVDTAALPQATHA
ncbi:MAG: transcriptional regulator [Acidovorax sp.]